MAAACQHCGKTHAAQARFCPETGKPLAVASAGPGARGKGGKPHGETLACPHCGGRHAPEAQFCPETGKPLIAGSDGESHGLSALVYAAGAALVLLVLVIAGLGQSPPGSTINSAASPAPRRTAVPNLTPTRPNQTPTRKPTRTPARTSTPAAPAGSWLACGETYRSRLHVGDTAYVSYDPPLSNRVRADASLAGKIVGMADPGDKLEILDGPSCSNQWVWWYVRVKGTKVKGWTSEGDRTGYWLIPTN